MVLIQITLGSGATQISAHGIAFKQLIVQNNATHNCRLGDSTVVAGAYGTGKGILLSGGGGSANLGAVNIQGDLLSNIYLAGTAADVIDCVYIAA